MSYAENGRPESTVEASLTRLKNWDLDNAGNLQAAYDGLLTLGCVPHPAANRNPQPGAYSQPYLRWTPPRHPGGSVGYLNAVTFSVTGKNDMSRVAGLPRANAGPEVRFPVTSPEAVQQALDVVRHLLGRLTLGIRRARCPAAPRPRVVAGAARPGLSAASQA